MMRALHLSEMARTVSGHLRGEDAQFESVSTDSRRVRARQLFFAIRGERFQDIAGRRRPFDDARQTAACLREWDGAGGMT